MATTRTFVAVGISSTARRQIADLIAQLSRRADGVRWMDAANLHYTLKFLGEVRDELLPDICRGVQLATSDAGPFSLIPAQIGAFPTSQRPRALWIGASRGGEALTQLQRAVETNLLDLGFPGESRAFVPHLTLGRLARAGRAEGIEELLDEYRDFTAAEQDVREVRVYSSQRTARGPVYDVVGRATLK